MTEAQYEAKFKDMQKYVPFIQRVIDRLKVNNEQMADNPRKAQLEKMEKLHDLLTNKVKNIKVETLEKCEGVIKRLQNKLEMQTTTLQNEDNILNKVQLKQATEQAASLKILNISQTEESSGPASPPPELIEDVLEQPVVIPTERRCSPILLKEKVKQLKQLVDPTKIKDSPTHSTKEQHFQNLREKVFTYDNNRAAPNKHQYNNQHHRSHYDGRSTTSHNYHHSSRPNTPLHRETPASVPQKLQTVKVVITEPLPAHVKQQHFPSSNKYLPRSSICHNNLKTLPQVSPLASKKHEDNNEAYSPEELWEEYNESHNKPINPIHSVSPVFKRLGAKVPEIPQLAKETTTTNKPSGRYTPIPDVLKSPPLSVNDINNLLLESGVDKNDISAIGTRRPTKQEPDHESASNNSFELLRKKLAHTVRMNSPILESSKQREHKGERISATTSNITQERIALKYNPHPRQERLQSVSSTDGSECSTQSKVNDPRLKMKLAASPGGPAPVSNVNVLPTINLNDPRLKKQNFPILTATPSPLRKTLLTTPPCHTSTPIMGYHQQPQQNSMHFGIRTDPRICRQTPNTPARRLSISQPQYSSEENWDSDEEEKPKIYVKTDPRLEKKREPPRPEQHRPESRIENRFENKFDSHARSSTPRPTNFNRNSLGHTRFSGEAKADKIPGPRNNSEENWPKDNESPASNKSCPQIIPHPQHKQNNSKNSKKSKNICQKLEPATTITVPNPPKSDTEDDWDSEPEQAYVKPKTLPIPNTFEKATLPPFHNYNSPQTYVSPIHSVGPPPLVPILSPSTSYKPTPSAPQYPLMAGHNLTFPLPNPATNNRFSCAAALNDNSERFKYFEAKKQKSEEPRTYKEFREAKERALAQEAALKKAADEAEAKRRAETIKEHNKEKEKIEPAQQNDNNRQTQKDFNKKLEDKKSNHKETFKTTIDKEKNVNLAGESTLDKMYRTQNFYTQFPKANTSFKIPKKRTEEKPNEMEIEKGKVNKTETKTNEAVKDENKLEDKKTVSSLTSKTLDKLELKNNENNSLKVSESKEKSNENLMETNIDKINNRDPRCRNKCSKQITQEEEKNKEQDKEKVEDKDKDKNKEKVEENNKEKSKEKVEITVEEKLEQTGPEKNDDKKENEIDEEKSKEDIEASAKANENPQLYGDIIITSAENEFTLKPQQNLTALDKFNKLAQYLNPKPQRILKRRNTMVVFDSAPLVDKEKLKKANAMLFEDVQEEEKRKRKQEEEERQIARRNKHLEEMFKKTDDNCTVSTQNIITGKRRTRATINFNETVNAINVFKHKTIKDTSLNSSISSTGGTQQPIRSTRSNFKIKLNKIDLKDKVIKGAKEAREAAEESESESKEINKATANKEGPKTKKSEESDEDIMKMATKKADKIKAKRKGTKGNKRHHHSEEESESEEDEPEEAGKGIKQTKAQMKTKAKAYNTNKTAKESEIEKTEESEEDSAELLTKKTDKIVKQTPQNKIKTQEANKNLELKETSNKTKLVKKIKTANEVSAENETNFKPIPPENEHQNCAVSSTSTDNTSEDLPIETCSSSSLRNTNSMKKELDDNEPSSTANKSLNPTPTPEANVEVLNEIVDKILKPNSDREHVLSLLGQILSEEKLGLIKSIIETSQKQNEEQITQQKEMNEEESHKAKENEILAPKTPARNNEEKQKEDIHEMEEEEELEQKRLKTLKEAAEEGGKKMPVLNKKKRSELDRLNEDIRDMFICEGVLTATGRRMCTIMGKEVGTDKKSSEAETSNKRKPNVRSNLRRSLRSLKTQEETEEDDNNSLDTRNSEVSLEDLERSTSNESTPQRKMPVLKPHTPIKIPEEVDIIKTKSKETNKRKTDNKFSLKPKKAKINEGDSESEEKDSETEAEEEEEKLETEKEGKPINSVIAIKNNNVHWHNQSKYTTWCMICEKRLSAMTSSVHYKTHHGENYISRMAPVLLQQFKQGKLNKPIFGVKKQKQNSWFFRCPFCLKYFNTPLTLWLEHFLNHTVEFRYECSKCHRGNNRKLTVTRHLKNCEGATLITSAVKLTVPTVIKAHVCHLCNFLQLKRANLERHYIEQHQMDKKTVDLLGYTITLFDVENVECVTEDKAGERENEAWKTIETNEQVIDIEDEEELAISTNNTDNSEGEADGMEQANQQQKKVKESLVKNVEESNPSPEESGQNKKENIKAKAKEIEPQKNDKLHENGAEQNKDINKVQVEISQADKLNSLIIKKTKQNEIETKQNNEQPKNSTIHTEKDETSATDSSNKEKIKPLIIKKQKSRPKQETDSSNNEKNITKDSTEIPKSQTDLNIGSENENFLQLKDLEQLKENNKKQENEENIKDPKSSIEQDINEINLNKDKVDVEILVTKDFVQSEALKQSKDLEQTKESVAAQSKVSNQTKDLNKFKELEQSKESASAQSKDSTKFKHLEQSKDPKQGEELTSAQFKTSAQSKDQKQTKESVSAHSKASTHSNDLKQSEELTSAQSLDLQQSKDSPPLQSKNSVSIHSKELSLSLSEDFASEHSNKASDTQIPLEKDENASNEITSKLELKSKLEKDNKTLQSKISNKTLPHDPKPRHNTESSDPDETLVLVYLSETEEPINSSDCEIINEKEIQQDMQDELLNLAAQAAEKVQEKEPQENIQDELLTLATQAAEKEQETKKQNENSLTKESEPQTSISDIISNSIDFIYKRGAKRKSLSQDSSEAKQLCQTQANVFMPTREENSNSPTIQILAQSIINVEENNQEGEITKVKPITMAERLSQRFKDLQNNTDIRNKTPPPLLTHTPKENVFEKLINDTLKELEKEKNSVTKQTINETSSSSSSTDFVKAKENVTISKAIDNQKQHKAESSKILNTPIPELITVISDDEDWEDIEITETAPTVPSSNTGNINKSKNKGLYQKFGLFKGNNPKNKKHLTPLAFMPKKKNKVNNILPVSTSNTKANTTNNTTSSNTTSITSSISTITTTKETCSRSATDSPFAHLRHHLGFKPVINIMEDLLPDSPCNDPIDLVPELAPLEPLQDLNDISSILDSNLSAVNINANNNHTSIEEALDFVNEQQEQRLQDSQNTNSSSNSNSCSGSLQAKTASNNIYHVGFSRQSLGENSFKFYCLLENCSFLFSSDAMGLETHFILEHAQIKWNGYCYSCQAQCFPETEGREELSITKEIKHMMDKHANKYGLDINNADSNSSGTAAPEDRPKIKLRRLTGDCLSRSTPEITSTTTSCLETNVSETKTNPSSSCMLGALLVAKPKPPTIEMPPQPQMPLTEPLLLDSNRVGAETPSAFSNVNGDFLITSVSSAACSTKQTPLQISSVISLSRPLNSPSIPSDPVQIPKISNVRTLAPKAGNLWSQQIEKERVELKKAAAESLEVSRILANANNNSNANPTESQRAEDDSPVIVAETVPIAQNKTGDFVITQTFSAQYNDFSSAALGFNINIAASSTQDKTPSESPASSSAATSSSGTITSRQYKCMAAGCKFVSRVPVAMSDHLRFHERRNFTDKRDYFACGFCFYTASDVEDYMKHAELYHIISKTGAAPLALNSNETDTATSLTKKIQNILNSSNSSNNAANLIRNSYSKHITPQNAPQVQDTEEVYLKKLRDTIDEIVGSTGLADDKLYRCIIKNCHSQLTESTFLSHILYHINTAGHNPNNYTYKCPHCNSQYNRPAGIKAHIKNHARNRYFCYLCEQTSTNPGQLLKHFSEQHWHTLNMYTKELLKPKISTDGSNLVLDSGYYVAYTQDLSDEEVRKFGEKLILEWQRKKSGSKTHFKSSEIDLLPMTAIFTRDINCGECEYKTKVRTNMFRHLQMHKQNPGLTNKGGVTKLFSVDPVNPVPCLNSSERFFDKMTNLASSSLISSSSTSSSNSNSKSNVKIPYTYVLDSKRFTCGCGDCNYHTISEELFRTHLSTLHSSTSTYRCAICQEEICKRGITIDRIVNHLRFHGSCIYRCEECNYVHYLRYVVERHVNEKHATLKVNIVKHERSSEENVEGIATAVPFAGKKYKETSETNNPTPTSIPITRSANSESSATKPTTSAACTTAKGKGKWVCDICGHKAGSVAQMQTHCQQQHGVKNQYKCAHCNFGSQQLSQILGHIDDKHSGMVREARSMYYKEDCAKEKVADTRPLWQRNDPTRVRHIRGILMEDEEESEEYRKKLALTEEDLEDDDDDEEVEIEIEIEDQDELNGSNYLIGYEFGCFHCEVRTQTFQDLKEHHYKNLHNGEEETAKPFWYRLLRKFCCPECRAFVGVHGELEHHLRNSHYKTRFYAADVTMSENADTSLRLLCGFCPVHCASADDLLRHQLRVQHAVQDIRIDNNEQIMDILNLGQAEVSYQCTLCTDIFPNRVAIVQHACNAHGGEESFSFRELSNSLIYRCHCCCFTSTKEIDLMRHMIDHFSRFKTCQFCHAPQTSFNVYMQHCYAEHKNVIHKFRTLYPLLDLRKYLLQMLIVFPNGLVVNKRNLLNTKYGKTEVIEELYEEMYKISQQPPIPRLSIARLVARKSIEAQHKHLDTSSPQDDLLEAMQPKPKPISKRRRTLVVSLEENKAATNALVKPKINIIENKPPAAISKRRTTADQHEQQKQEDFSAPLQMAKISKRRRTVAVDRDTLFSSNLLSNTSQSLLAAKETNEGKKSKTSFSNPSPQHVNEITYPSNLDQESFSFYGKKTEILDLSKIYTKVAIGGIKTPLTIDKFKLLFNIECQLKLTKCDDETQIETMNYNNYKHIKKACPASHKLKYN